MCRKNRRTANSFTQWHNEPTAIEHWNLTTQHQQQITATVIFYYYLELENPFAVHNEISKFTTKTATAALIHKDYERPQNVRHVICPRSGNKNSIESILRAFFK